VIVLTAFISPYSTDRDRVRTMVGEGNFIEIYCKAAIEVCELRDTKGLYKKARAGLIAEFTGISSPYEAPVKPELVIATGIEDLDVCIEQVVSEMVQRGIING
jgi:adenylylsulfate kinase